MNTVVVYDSQFGNTEQLARTIADTLRIFGSAQAIRIDAMQAHMLQGVDLLLIGSPTQGFRPTPAIQSFLANIPSQSLRERAVACFDTRFRGVLWKISAAPQMVKQLRAMGIEPVVPPESFFVKSMKKEGPLLPGEVERAARWAVGIQQQYERRKVQDVTALAGGDGS
jgi:flavorubredoxin